MVDTKLDCREIRRSDGVLYEYGSTAYQVWKVSMGALVDLHDKAFGFVQFADQHRYSPSSGVDRNALVGIESEYLVYLGKPYCGDYSCICLGNLERSISGYLFQIIHNFRHEEEASYTLIMALMPCRRRAS